MEEMLRVDREGRIIPRRGLTRAGTILAFRDWVERKERERLLNEIESTFPTYYKWDRADSKKRPLCDEYQCGDRVREIIATLRESADPGDA